MQYVEIMLMLAVAVEYMVFVLAGIQETVFTGSANGKSAI